MVNYYAAVFLLRPPYSLCCETLFEEKNACKTQETCVSVGVWGVLAVLAKCTMASQPQSLATFLNLKGGKRPLMAYGDCKRQGPVGKLHDGKAKLLGRVIAQTILATGASQILHLSEGFCKGTFRVGKIRVIIIGRGEKTPTPKLSAKN